MDGIKLITPIEGQKNWGNAINSNFLHLEKKYKTVLNNIQGLNNKLEELDTLKIKKDNFIYLAKQSGETKAYIVNVNKWDNPDTSTPFAPDANTYTNYDSWFVKVQNNGSADYNIDSTPITWHTGDLLIIYKTSGVGTSIEQWPNLMGGYYKPIASVIAETQLQTTYQPVPTLSAFNNSMNNDISIDSPLIHWKPVSYKNGKLTFSAYDGNSEGSLTQFTNKILEIPFITKGNGNYFSPVGSDGIITIGSVFANTVTTDMENIGFDLVCTDDNNNILYFAYTYEKTTDQKLKITIIRNGYSGVINARVNVFNAV